MYFVPQSLRILFLIFASLTIATIPVLAQTPPMTNDQPTQSPSEGTRKQLEKVEAQCAAKNFAGAIQTALAISESKWRDWAFGIIVGAQAQTGDYKGAKQTLTYMRSAPRTVNLLILIATLQDLNPNVPKTEGAKSMVQALAVAESITNLPTRDAAREVVALAYLRQSNINVAQTITRRIQTPARKLQPLIEIARQQTVNQNYTEASKNARTAYALLKAQPPSYGQSVALSRIVPTQLACGDIADALKSGLLMNVPSYRANWLAQVGYHIAYAGDRTTAYKVIQEAQKAFRNVSDSYYQDVVRAELVIALVEVGHRAEAKAIFARMYDPKQKERAQEALNRSG